LDNGIKLVKKLDVAPATFKGTKLELISNTYQYYRFNKFQVHYKTNLPNSINASFIAFIDPDPLSNIDSSNLTSEDILRIANAHQGAVQANVTKPWIVSLPQRRDDQLFYVGDSGDDRLRKMGTLYIYQVGRATRFDGSFVTEELSAGTLNMYYEIMFSSPQLQPMTRIYNYETLFNTLRLNMLPVNKMTYIAAIASAATLATTKYRQANIQITTNVFPGKGNYLIKFIPGPSLSSTWVRTVSLFALPYTYGPVPYKAGGTNPTDMFSMLGSTITQPDFNNFMIQNFNHATRPPGGKATIMNNDVGSQVYQLFNPALSESQINVNDNNLIYVNLANAPCSGQVLVYNDDEHTVLVQGLVEYDNATQAVDAGSHQIHLQLEIYKVVGLPDPLKPIMPSLTAIPTRFDL